MDNSYTNIHYTYINGNLCESCNKKQNYKVLQGVVALGILVNITKLRLTALSNSRDNGKVPII